MKRLSAAAFEAARQHLFDDGRPLDQARFRFFFEKGEAADVVAELARFQNPDGGFGHGLEPDLRTPVSSAIATATGCGVLRQVGALPTEAFVECAIAYFADSYHAARQRWPIVPPAVEEAPHAPWWTHAEIEQNFAGSLVNPTASIVGYLYDYPTLTSPPLLSDVTAALVARLERAADEMEMHDLQCWIVLAEASNLPALLRQQVGAKLRRAAQATVERDPQKWTGYGLPPLEVAPTPDSFLADVIERLRAQLPADLPVSLLPDAAPGANAYAATHVLPGRSPREPSQEHGTMRP